MPPNKKPVDDLVSRARKFVEQQRGRWDHAAWEKLVNDLSKSGVDMGDDARRHLGNMLEAVKHFYTELSAPAKKKKAGAKKKKKSAAKPKKKSAASKKKSGAKKKSSAKKKAGTKKKSTSKKKASA
jgi:hypothetical protein